MSLISDLKEAKSLWTKSSCTFRIGLVFSTFMATGSIASLSDVVFKWKGFILEGILFYRSWVSTPLKELFSHFDIMLPIWGSDMLLFMLIIAAGYSRVLFTYDMYSDLVDIDSQRELEQFKQDSPPE